VVTGAVRTHTAPWSAGGGPTGTRAVVSGVGTVFAVGCPVCNKLVVALLGTGMNDVFHVSVPGGGAGLGGVLPSRTYTGVSSGT
jgi:hypothetical protein